MIDTAVVRSILETRLHNGPKVAELAARRRPADLPDRLDAVVADLAAAAVAGVPILRTAVRALMVRTVAIDLLVSVAAIGAMRGLGSSLNSTFGSISTELNSAG